MSWWEMTGDGTPRAVGSPFDSARFGRPVERLTVPAGAGPSFGPVREAVLGSAADVIVLRYPAGHVGWFAELTSLGRTAVFADSLAYWRLRAGRGRAPEPRADLRAACPLPAAAVPGPVSDIFAAYRSHYVANPLFDASAALEGYREWAVRSAASGRCVALREHDAHDAHDDGSGVLALATLADDDGPGGEPTGGNGTGGGNGDGDGITGGGDLGGGGGDGGGGGGGVTEILLAGVVSRARGRGLYGHLLAAVEERVLARGGREVVISTQGHNTGVQRAWARYGFEPVHAFLTVHLIRSRLLRGPRR
ncbi:GNAT family N-acetyltransferase [Streptosporangium sp. NPDC023615]|uniref:GNAT family N-acetyltransferase n=1 Tax=Streptosporangium sp. NPDC023615 TaxID=3154794 RepID=UPI003424B052